MDLRKCKTITDPTTSYMGPLNFVNTVQAKNQVEDHEASVDLSTSMDVDIDLRELYFLIMHFLSAGPCQKTCGQLAEELLEHKLLPRRYHAWYSRSGGVCGEENDGHSFHLNYDSLVKRYSHIEKNHLVKLLKQLMLITPPPLRCMSASAGRTAADVPTLLGTDSFSLLSGERNIENKQATNLPSYLRWPHMKADQVRALRLREMGGGFSKHHRAPSIRFACYAIAKPSVLVPKMQNTKKLRGHRDAVYCAIFDRSGRYVITGSDDRLVKIWSMETALCLASCRGHEGDITDLSVSSTNVLVASASNDYSIRVWRLPDGLPISVLRGHTGAVTAIAFCPRPNAIFQLLSSSDDGTCRLWDARNSQCSPRVYLPKPIDATAGKSSSIPSAAIPLNTTSQRHQILCCAFNVNGTVFVTGSSDTFARVWNACKPSTDDPGQPSHEIDILAGHENDVNYVQFSGCAVPSRSSPTDTSAEDSFPKFRSSWFSHDCIVTCSRDGSAIIWMPRSRRSHGKIGRWTRAYHLKVPPPPLPPQPPRGGPRQRLLPTPRGVNMIVWSLDNRFVLAAIMDNRICVWNANDGSLVHSLAGHTASTYVLDVHPFNPRIAMSAGYDGKTILWDIWEGTPIHVYDIDGRFKLVDGKFSQDGTSIVLSDDVGQIYLLNTGEGESQKDAKYDQFFLGDYRPLIQDAYGNVIDQETQLVPYRRNIQDALCDSSMLPYPEPYQSMYQRRRLGALGIEWRPSSIKFAIGIDIGIGQEFPMLPLPDLDVPFEPLPDYLDALYLEPENDAMNDDNDSEYNVTEEYISDEPIDHSDSASSDSECSEEDKVRRNQKDSGRRSRQRKPVLDLNLTTSSGRQVKKRTSDERGGASSSSKRYKKLKVRQGTSRKKCTEAKSLRPRRVAARNAVNNLSQMTEDFTDEEDEDGSAGYSSTNESSFETSVSQREGHSDDVNEQRRYSGALKASPEGSEVVGRPLAHNDLPVNTGNKKKLVLKLSLKHRIVPSGQESYTHQSEGHSNVASSSQIACEENSKGLFNPGFSSTSLVDKDLPETFKKLSGDVEKSAESENELKAVRSCDTSISWGKLKLRTSNATQSAKSPGNIIETHIPASALSPIHGNKPISSGSGACNNQKLVKEEKDSSSFLHTGFRNVSLDANNCHQNSPKKKTIIKIKKSQPQGKMCSPASLGAPGEGLSPVGEASLLGHPLAGNKHAETGETPQPHVNCDNNSTSGGFRNHGMVPEMPDLDTDAVRRSRSFKLKVPSQENVVTDAFGIDVDYLQPCTSRSSGKSLTKVDNFAQDGWPFVSKHTVRPRSSRKKGDSYWTGSGSSLARGVSLQVPAKLNWLLLLQQEEGYRYIPQMGDKVVYMRQGHQGCPVQGTTVRYPPWEMYGDKLRAVEVCEVEDLKYATFSGSGSSCCKLSLKFLDSTRGLTGEKFQLILPELNESPDFVVEKTLYDAAMERTWRMWDKCSVWWRDASGSGGAWWTGEIIDIKDSSDSFPGSPWERYTVKYENDTTDHHCPWELFEEDSSWVQPHIINSGISGRIMSCFSDLVQKANHNKDRYGFCKLNEVVHRADFQNRIPVPLSPDIILGRLESNNYYRNVRSIQHDIDIMLSNAEFYFADNSEFKKKISRLSKFLERELPDLWQ